MLLVVACALLTEWSFGVPSVAPPDSAGFSGARAMEVLTQLIDDEPHPTGSPALEQTRVRLVEAFRGAGFEPQLQRVVCPPPHDCAEVVNVSVLVQGPSDHIAMFSAHLDSTPYGPGAGDDGASVAILVELAHYLKNHPPENDILLLVTDGEEIGLVGADAFVRHDPRARRVATAVNLEARGQSGRSILFRTSGENAWLIDAYAEHAPNPTATSVGSVVFDLMPHDTDLSVWEAFGIAGLDFAFIEDESAYHSAADTVANLDPGSVQSQGDNALAMLRALSNADLGDPPRGYAVWFDVFGLFLVHWPRGLTIWLALATLAGAVGGWWRLVRCAPVLTASVFALVAVPVAWIAPDLAYLLLVPCWGAALGSFAGRTGASLFGLTGACVVWFPILKGIAIALGVLAAPVLVVGGAMCAIWAVPFIRGPSTLGASTESHFQ